MLENVGNGQTGVQMLVHLNARPCPVWLLAAGRRGRCDSALFYCSLRRRDLLLCQRTFLLHQVQFPVPLAREVRLQLRKQSLLQLLDVRSLFRVSVQLNDDGLFDLVRVGLQCLDLLRFRL